MKNQINRQTSKQKQNSDLILQANSKRSPRVVSLKSLDLVLHNGENEYWVIESNDFFSIDVYILDMGWVELC